MPRKNGTGPARGGFGSGGVGQGRGQGNRMGGNRRAGGAGAGLGGECVCPSCGATAPHRQGIPCTQTNCPQCGQPMVRK